MSRKLLHFKRVYQGSLYQEGVCVSRRNRARSDSPLTFKREEVIVEKLDVSSLEDAVGEVIRKGAQIVARDGQDFYVVKLINKNAVKKLFHLGETYLEQRAWEKELYERSYAGMDGTGPAKLMEDITGSQMIHRTTRHGPRGPNWIVF